MLRPAITAFALITASSANAEDANRSRTMWTLFQSLCPAAMAAKTPAAMIALFGENDAKVGITQDGALWIATGTVEDHGIADLTGLTVHVTRTVLEGGTLASCNMVAFATAGDMTMQDLPALVQREADALIGDDFRVQGGVMTDKDQIAMTVFLSTPDFPPTQTLWSHADNRVATITMTRAVADE